MNRVLVSLTARQLLGRRRTLVIALVLALPVLIGAIFRFSGDSDSAITSEEFAIGLNRSLILTLLLPLVALVLGTAALGAEIEDGTVVFLLSKPIARWRIMIVKTVVAGFVTIVFVVPATMLTTWIVHDSVTNDGLFFGLGLGAAVASLLYCAVFVALSAVTSRALVIGLVYVFVWEAIISNLFNALRWVSIREYAIGTSDAFITIADRDLYDPRLSVASAVIASIVLTVGAVLLGIRSLRSFEIGE